MGGLEPVGDVADASALEPEQLGFMCGLEIHQQLATGKLHSRQPGILYDHTIDTIPADWPRVSRHLRAAEGEAGEVDVAARFEAFVTRDELERALVAVLDGTSRD